MSQQAISILALTIAATAAVAANRFVNPQGAQVVADANAIGVARAPAAIGEQMTVDVQGTALVETGAAITKGATRESGALGRSPARRASGSDGPVVRRGPAREDPGPRGRGGPGQGAVASRRAA